MAAGPVVDRKFVDDGIEPCLRESLDRSDMSCIVLDVAALVGDDEHLGRRNLTKLVCEAIPELRERFENRAEALEVELRPDEMKRVGAEPHRATRSYPTRPADKPRLAVQWKPSARIHPSGDSRGCRQRGP